MWATGSRCRCASARADPRDRSAACRLCAGPRLQLPDHDGRHRLAGDRQSAGRRARSAYRRRGRRLPDRGPRRHHGPTRPRSHADCWPGAGRPVASAFSARARRRSALPRRPRGRGDATRTRPSRTCARSTTAASYAHGWRPGVSGPRPGAGRTGRRLPPHRGAAAITRGLISLFSSHTVAVHPERVAGASART